MGNRLTPEEWRAIKPPFYWMKLKLTLSPLQIDFIDKWLDEHTNGWWHRDEGLNSVYTYVFEVSGDDVSFKLWASNNPFTEDHGELT